MIGGSNGRGTTPSCTTRFIRSDMKATAQPAETRFIAAKAFSATCRYFGRKPACAHSFSAVSQAQRDELVKKYNNQVEERNEIVTNYNKLVERLEERGENC